MQGSIGIAKYLWTARSGVDNFQMVGLDLCRPNAIMMKGIASRRPLERVGKDCSKSAQRYSSQRASTVHADNGTVAESVVATR